MQILQALDYCHRRQLVHRDLKPANILVFESPSMNGYILKIADWGLGRHICQPANSFTVEVQTMLYRAPEILENVGVYHCEVDMWSAGLIIGEMLKGLGQTFLSRSINSEFQLIKEWHL